MLMTLAVLASACSAPGLTDDDTATASPRTSPPVVTAEPFVSPPPVASGPLAPETTAALDSYLQTPSPDTIQQLGETGDARLLWVLSDIIRFANDASSHLAATEAAAALSGLDLPRAAGLSWVPLTDQLIAWDLPAFEGYPDYKAAIFTAFEPGWQAFFDDADSAIDWPLVSWGGVRIDDRPLGDTDPCPEGCIPALDNPPLVAAAHSDWYPDDAIVFGVHVGNDTVAFPKNVMEIHEMVNATLGGRRVAIPYCTLCGAAQLFFTDSDGGGVGEIVMRTSGLLHRSNKVMYDLATHSVFDTFTGRAVSGPLLDDGVVLEQATVVTSRWGDWRRTHPDTLIVAEDGGIGRDYPADPLRGRDDDGPIFPIGKRDPRLAVHEPVVGVILPDDTAVAFPAAAARRALEEGQAVTLAGVTVHGDGGGLVARLDGQPLPSHQSFWFAWSQFHPDTLLWNP